MHLQRVAVRILVSAFLVCLVWKTSAAVTPTPTPKTTSSKAAKTSSTKPTPQVTAKPSVQATAKSSPQVSATKTVVATQTARMMPKGSPTATPTITPTPIVDPVLLKSADDAYAAKKYMEALALYQEYQKKHGTNLDLEQKIDLAEYFAGKTLQEAARTSLRVVKKKKKLNRTAHNIMRYGKEQPTRSAHPFSLSLCLLTPDLFGFDLGYTFKAHWNIGMGYGPLLNTYNPRLKYYFKGDVSSFFLGWGYSTYSLNLSTSTNGQSTFMGQKVDGSASGGVKGHFTYLSFGPSLQAGDGCFMEFELDLGMANLAGSGKASGNASDSGPDGISTSTSKSSNGDFHYSGPMGMIGVRWGWAF